MKGNIFIKRPVMALSISVLILIVGFISLYTLPVEQYPDIAPPTVRVEATYTGVNADAVMNSVIMPLEESINGVENMIYITSTATNAGTAEILVYFKQGTDPDMAAVNVQNRVSAAQGLLPSEVTAIGVSTMKRQNSFLFASIDNVVETLVIAIILVVLVVYFFLHDFKSTLIPSISIIVSLIGTFAFLSVARFSINILTLFALVLAIGTVVDDAIIVVEAVQAKFDVGYRSSYLATKDAMSDVTMAVVSCTFVFMAVFIPVTFMGGTSGVFYTQFGITMAVAVGLSCINALTLCPALCAMMMKASDTEKSIKSFSGRIRAAYTVSFNTMLGKYKKGLMFFFHHRWTVWASLGVATVLLVYLMSTTKTGLVPQEDQGTMMINISTSPGNSLAETNKVMDKVQDILKATP